MFLQPFLQLSADKLRTIIFDGGIICNGERNIVNKNGMETLVLNGSFNLQNFNLKEGVLVFGPASMFTASDVVFCFRYVY
jgi:hypothetical protein